MSFSRLDKVVAMVYLRAKMLATGEVPLRVALGGEAGLEREAEDFLRANAEKRQHSQHLASEVEAGHWEEAAEELAWEDKQAWRAGHAPRPIVPWEPDFKEVLPPGVRQVFDEKAGE